MKKKVLFFAEAVTLAHVARPAALCRSLDSQHLDLSIACAARSHWLLKDFPGQVHELDSIPSQDFLARLEQGVPLYDAPQLLRYIEEDLRLIDSTKPDIVIGDFRISLSISARLRSTPYLAISNAYWSPYWRPRAYPVPNLPLTHFFPLGVAQFLFNIARPLAFALHCRPLNQVRRHFGMASLGNDLRRIYTDADHILYADVPELFPGIELPANHYFIGPLLWSPPVPLPDWWRNLPEVRPLVYVTLGSSGQAKLLPEVLQALSVLDATIVVSTAGAVVPAIIPENVYVAPYLNGTEAARRASLVICNGGSPTSQQALAAGVPVIGIASNLDQFLNMDTLSVAGVGSVLRADHFKLGDLSELAQTMLSENRYYSTAQKLAQMIGEYNLDPCLGSIIDKLVKPNRGASDG